ncbi:hypothetical protein [Nocardioides sp.]|uniref:hypothetical protein n=1 Tax=Nocardioides sp. TaxID=35761 RepID=UPI00261B378A|nr:hypothetical protein [Nocardioides sp.]MCW2735459.1 hypothetical protein [Nocardioides sp.]
MNMQDGPLFSGQNIDALRSTSRQRLDKALAGIGTVKECDDPATAARLLKDAQLELPELDRDKTTLTPSEEEGNNLTITAGFPVPQGWSLLEVRPNNFTLSPPVGRVDRYSVASGTPVLLISRSFPRGTSPDAMKAWARKEADVVDRWIEWLAVDVRMHNAGLEERIAAGLAERKRQLQDIDDLRDGLSGGI